MQIQPTIQRFARMLSSVLQLEVEIVDNSLCRVAGTGVYGKFLGRKLSTDSRLLRYIIETKKEKVVTHSRFDPLCEGCENNTAKKHNGIYVTIMNWREDKIIRFIDIVSSNTYEYSSNMLSKFPTTVNGN